MIFVNFYLLTETAGEGVNLLSLEQSVNVAMSKMILWSEREEPVNFKMWNFIFPMGPTSWTLLPTAKSHYQLRGYCLLADNDVQTKYMKQLCKSMSRLLFGIVALAHNGIPWGSLEQALLHMFLLAAGAILAVKELRSWLETQMEGSGTSYCCSQHQFWWKEHQWLSLYWDDSSQSLVANTYSWNLESTGRKYFGITFMG